MTGLEPLSSLCLDGIVAPRVVLEIAAGRPVVPLWRNEISGVTFSLGEGAEYVRHGPPHPEFDPASEAERLRWVGDYVTAPRPLSHGVDASGAWLHTAGVAGTSAVLGEWRERPEVVVPELGRMLRHFHDVVPLDRCRWEWSVPSRLAAAGKPAEALGPVPELDLVVCHGDACNPNFLLDADGRAAGYVDLGNLGVADRWADLAPALLSLSWNFGAGWQPAFLVGYGIDSDRPKQDFYTRAWNLG